MRPPGPSPYLPLALDATALLCAAACSGLKVAAVQSAASGRFDLPASHNIALDLQTFRAIVQPLSQQRVALAVLPEAVFWGYALAAANATAARARMAAYAEAMPLLGTVACAAEARERTAAEHAQRQAAEGRERRTSGETEGTTMQQQKEQKASDSVDSSKADSQSTSQSTSQHDRRADSAADAPILSGLSCIAKDAGIAIVADVVSSVDCKGGAWREGSRGAARIQRSQTLRKRDRTAAVKTLAG